MYAGASSATYGGTTTSSYSTSYYSIPETTTESTYSGVAVVNYYAMAKGDDVFVPLVSPSVDSGNIFYLGHVSVFCCF